MNNRIKLFMDYRNISSSELADTIGVQRSNVTHVLHGRNKPSFPFISKLLESYPEIDAKWLILGTGNMLEEAMEQQQQKLFQESIPYKEPEKKPFNPIKLSLDSVIPLEQSNSQVSPTPTAKVERIVVFYTDQTFKEYSPTK